MLPYTAIYQNNEGKITRYTAQASNDRKEAWAQLCAMKESDGECLILLVPGDHPVVQYTDTINNNGSPQTRIQALFTPRVAEEPFPVR